MIHTSYKSQLMLGLSALVFLLVPMVSWATTLVPTDLNPGDTYHLVFVSSTFRDANSTAIADYNAHVQAAADNATISIGVGSSIGDIIWKAIGTTDSVNAIDNINVSGPVYRIDNVRVADDETDLFDGSIQASISITENGVFQLGPVFTGSLSDGTDDNDLLELGDATGSNSYVGSPI